MDFVFLKPFISVLKYPAKSKYKSGRANRFCAEILCYLAQFTMPSDFIKAPGPKQPRCINDPPTYFTADFSKRVNLVLQNVTTNIYA